MQFISKDILSILLRIKDLLRIERNMREDRVYVEPGLGGGNLDSDEPRPWKPLPNIRNFKIEIQLNDWLLLLFGLEKSYSPSLELYPWSNGRANAYVDYMFNRLKNEVELREFDNAYLTFNLLLNSPSYQIISFNYVANGWYKNMNWNLVKNILNEVRYLCSNNATRINFNSVYLETPGNISPLGVPTLPWSVYLHMVNNLIVQWSLVSESGKQHGYLPKNGLITAWSAIFDKMNTSPNIFEADFNSFFDKVSHYSIELELKTMGFPNSGYEYLIKMNNSLVTLDPEEEDPINEPSRNVLYHADGTLNEDSFYNHFENSEYDEWNWSSRGDDIPQLQFYSSFMDYSSERGEENEPMDLEDIEYIELMERQELNDMKTSQSLNDDNPSLTNDEGVPQGAATSCSLATLVLRYLERDEDLILYADDILLFPNSSTENPLSHGCLNSQIAGVSAHNENSGWVNRNGIWEKDLKFVGFTYTPPKNWDLSWENLWSPSLIFILIDLLVIGFPCTSLLWFFTVLNGESTSNNAIFSASTSNGATLEFSDNESFLMYLNNASTLLLNSSASGVLGGENLNGWIISNSKKWITLSNPLSLLFSNGMEKYNRPLYIEHINLTGWMFSSMQLNSWLHSIEQDFRLNWHSTSWIAQWWPTYMKNWGLSKSHLTLFTASSFACHALLELDSSSQSNSLRTNIRSVFST